MKRIIITTLLTVAALTALYAFQQYRKKVLIIGDSISIGYTPIVKEALKEKAALLPKSSIKNFRQS